MSAIICAGQELREFEEHYSEVVRNQASVTLLITKCTTIGPPRKGKTCLKHLLTGKLWDVEAGTASTDVMEAPEWVECYSKGEERAEELWRLVTEEEQRKKVIRAVTSRRKASLLGHTDMVQLKATPAGASPSSPVRDPAHPPSVSGSQHPPLVSGSQHSTSVSGSQHSTSVSGSQHPASVSGSSHPPSVSGSPPLPSVSGSPPPPSVSGSPPLPSVSGSPPPPSVNGSTPLHRDSGLPPTRSGSLNLDGASDASHDGQKSHTVMQGIEALTRACDPQALKEVLREKKGKVLGETQLIHFVDTGGQAIYHDIHPVLITSPSVYLVVLSLEDLKKDGLKYFRSDLVQRPLESICAFGMKSPQDKGHLEFHPEAPRIFIVGTHLDQIPSDGQNSFLQMVHEMIDEEINSKPYRQFVQFDTKGRSFWAVDNTLAGREQTDDVKKYISTLRLMVQDRSMEMRVQVPLTWMLLKVVMEGSGSRYCKYSELLKEACKFRYVSEDSPEADLDTMLKLFHILSLFYHKVPKGCKKEDSLVFIDPDCLYSATSDFLMAAKEEFVENQGGGSEGSQQRTQAATKGEEMTGRLQRKYLAQKERIDQRMSDNAKSIEREVLPIVDSTLTRIDRAQESIEKMLQSLHAELKEKGQSYTVPPEESQDASSVKGKRQLFIGRLVHSLADSVKAVLHNLEMKGDVGYARKEVGKAGKKITALIEGRSIKSCDMDQFLAILSDLRIVSKLSGSNRYVVPAALPQGQGGGFKSDKLKGPADPVLFSMVAETGAEVCYLPSCLFCCLINELVTRLQWTVIPLERTHVAFAHEGLTGRVHMMEHPTYIEIKVESHLPLEQMTHTCQTVRRCVCESIVQLYKNLYSGPTANPVWEDSLVWGFKCQEEHSEDNMPIPPHIAAFREEDSQLWTECMLEPWNVQDVERKQAVWFTSLQ